MRLKLRNREKHRRYKGNRDRTALHPRRSRIRGTPGERAERFLQGNLQPGEETEVIFKITEEELRFLTENERVESENGAFEVFIGSDSTTENKAEFVLKK